MKKTLIFASILSVMALTAHAETQATKLTGECANKQAYEVKVCADCVKSDQGAMNLYEYKGPLGVGSIPSKVSPEVAVKHVCKESGTRWMADDNSNDE